MCTAWHSHRLHNIAVFPVNRMSEANGYRPLIPRLIVRFSTEPAAPGTLTANLFPARRGALQCARPKKKIDFGSCPCVLKIHPTNDGDLCRCQVSGLSVVIASVSPITREEWRWPVHWFHADDLCDRIAIHQSIDRARKRAFSHFFSAEMFFSSIDCDRDDHRNLLRARICAIGSIGTNFG